MSDKQFVEVVGKRTLIGKIFKWLFVLFNIFMIWASVSTIGSGGTAINSTTDQYAQAGAAIGTTLGIGIILFFWVSGDIILGLFVLFTRPAKMLVQQS